jgi:hypothetical protein
MMKKEVKESENMLTKFKLNETVRVVGKKKGSTDEFARITNILEDGRYWISNMNMPFDGTISMPVTPDKIAKL